MRAVRASVAATLLLAACEQVRPPSDDAVFVDGSEVGDLRGANMREASGLTASPAHPGAFWLHNDSGNEPELFLIDATGSAKMRVRVQGASNRDWEDIAHRGDTLFIAETGDNGARWDTSYVYAVIEPKSPADSTAAVVASFPFQYPDGPRDAETLLIDPISGDWFIVTKREDRSRLYRYPAPQRQGVLVTVERMPVDFGFRLAVGGDVSPDGSEVLVKTYDAVYYWEREAGESLDRALSRPPKQQPYTAERQGEALAFALDGSAYYTTSEVELDVPQFLLRYARKSSPR
ncbi:MAG: hypothetical protein C0503_08260 [Gemmatimonas sp.]|nr:hypothetical protein [Gemmatimonas sp.]